jgi:hypothetical protein
MGVTKLEDVKNGSRMSGIVVDQAAFALTITLMLKRAPANGV